MRLRMSPIGYQEREYGYSPQTVSSHGNAVAAGMRQAAIVPTVNQGVRLVMVSSAY
ncbi:hypothetical protein [Arthrobacter sp. N199823]|uniref:hypothetical protein n=1 Tax=Arthrobacter sp. N199823 TaxID=2058895 RepID=UPI0015E2D2C4|nr:hypothetical protein [Arthrobacter sp. N199823]